MRSRDEDRRESYDPPIRGMFGLHAAGSPTKEASGETKAAGRETTGGKSETITTKEETTMHKATTFRKVIQSEFRQASYARFGHGNNWLKLECGHTKIAKASVPIPRATHCHDCWMEENRARYERPDTTQPTVLGPAEARSTD